jgi:hypothetical protein
LPSKSARPIPNWPLAGSGIMTICLRIAALRRRVKELAGIAEKRAVQARASAPRLAFGC